MKTFVIAVVLLACGSAPWGAKRAGAQGVDSCLAYFDTIPRWVWVPQSPGLHYFWSPGNPDSALVDTCASSPTYAEIYIQKWFEITFNARLLRIPWAPADSVVEVAWHAIDTSYATTRIGFNTLENKYGAFFLRKDDPTDTTTDWQFHIRFLQYVCADSVANDLHAIADVFGVGVVDSLRDIPDGVSQHGDFALSYPWPNPSYAIINLPIKPKSNVLLLNTLGQVIRIWPAETAEIFLDGISPGAYFLKEDTKTYRLIVR